VSFFIFEPPPPAHADEHEERPPTPPWHGPPENIVGRAVPIEFVLARTEKLALAVWGVAAFPTGITFSLATVLRESDEDVDLDPDMMMHRYWRRRRSGHGDSLPDELLRFGVQMADGTKATNLLLESWSAEAPPGPVLMPRGGGGGGRVWRQGWWLWPLPPEGALTFACEWPAHGIPTTTHEVDAAPIRDAAAEALHIWG
jgi:hypothetical protein